jgi:hypothetical protein
VLTGYYLFSLRRRIKLVEFSSDEAGDSGREFLKGVVGPMGGNGKRFSGAAGKAIAAARYNRFVRVSDFYAPTGSVADPRIAVIRLPAPDVELVERFAESVPLPGRRLYLLGLRKRWQS